MANAIIYGHGGYDPGHPTGNVVEHVTDNGDGTGTRVTYKPDGSVDASEDLTDLFIAPPPPVDPVADIMVALDKLGSDLAAAKSFADVAAIGASLKATAADLQAGVAVDAEVKP